MRQGNGTELLGTNDSQGANIGIIYVSPTDDRKSVLAAILTQEKLGRKQIAIALPDQNKAFQRPVDFDDLKSLRRKLQAQLIFIAPSGPGPAEFARQRRFTVYSSLENYASALRDQASPSTTDARKKIRGLFGSSKYKDELGQPQKAATNGTLPHEVADEEPDVFEEPAEGPVVAHTPAPLHADVEEEEEEQRRDDDKVPAMVGGAVAAGAIVAGAQALHQQAAHKPVVGDDTVDGVDAISLTDAHNQGHNGGFDDYDDEDAMLPPQSQQATPSKNEEARVVNGPSSRPGSTNSPEPIELKPVRSRGRSTAKLPPRDDEMDWEDDDEDYVVPPKRNTGKMVAAGVAGAVGLAAASMTNQKAAGGVLKKGSTGKLPPRGNAGVSGAAGGNGRPPRNDRRVRPWVAIPLILLTLLIVGGIFFSIAYANPKMFGDPLGRLGIKSVQPATVSITPDSKIIANSYVIQAVTNGKANPDQRQVMARQVVSQPQSQTKNVTGTGHNQVAATVAHGHLTFFNGSFQSFTVRAGERFATGNGIPIVTDGLAVIPAAVPGGSQGTTSVAAHALNAGAGGNIGIEAISGTCCTASNAVFVRNTSAFTGGQDAKDYSFVQQGDVNSFVNGIKNQLVNQANNQLKGSLKSGEQLATATQCPTTINTSNPIGDQGRNVPSTNVTVSVTCKALAYDGNALNSIVAKLLQTKAGTDAGQGYSLQGNIIAHPQVQPGGQGGNIFLLVSAKGLWVFQFTNTDKQQFAKDIAGKSVSDARTVLGSQPGVKDLTITVNNSVLPTDPNQISIVIQDVPGLQDTGNPGSTPTLPTATSSAQPGNGIINPGS